MLCRRASTILAELDARSDAIDTSLQRGTEKQGMREEGGGSDQVEDIRCIVLSSSESGEGLSWLTHSQYSSILACSQCRGAYGGE